jgi:hypothetical protein
MKIGTASSVLDFTNASSAAERLRALQDRANRFESLAADWAAKFQTQQLKIQALETQLAQLAGKN